MLSVPRSQQSIIVYDHACGVAKHLPLRAEAAAKDFLVDRGRLHATTGALPASGPALLIPKFHISNHKEPECATRRGLEMGDDRIRLINGEIAEQDNRRQQTRNYFISQYSIHRHLFLSNKLDLISNRDIAKKLRMNEIQ